MDIAQLLGPPPQVTLTIPNVDDLDPRKMWIHYDEDLDTLILYLDEARRSGVLRYVGRLYAIADPETNELIGVQAEGWETEIVPQFEDLRESWPVVKQSLRPRVGWSQLLRLIGPAILFLLVALVSDEANSSSGSPLRLQPA